MAIERVLTALGESPWTNKRSLMDSEGMPISEIHKLTGLSSQSAKMSMEKGLPS